MARLKEFYKSDVAPAMMSKFGYKSVMQIPKLDKVVINVGCGELKDNPKMLDAIVSDLGKITGQKAMPCKAHKSVANFKLARYRPDHRLRGSEPALYELLVRCSAGSGALCTRQP